MRQTSEEFMKVMEEFNEGPTHASKSDLAEKWAEELDSRIDKAVAAAMSKYQAEAEKIVDPIQEAPEKVEAPEEQAQEGGGTDAENEV